MGKYHLLEKQQKLRLLTLCSSSFQFRWLSYFSLCPFLEMLSLERQEWRPGLHFISSSISYKECVLPDIIIIIIIIISARNVNV